MSVAPIPPGFHTVTPYLVVTDATAQLTFLEKALAGEVQEVMRTPDGAVMHAQVRVGDSIVMLGQASGENAARPSMLYLYVEDVDAWYARAVEHAGTSVQEPRDEFYGDRTAAVEDANGNQWYFATHVEDVAPEEIERRAAEARG